VKCPWRIQVDRDPLRFTVLDVEPAGHVRGTGLDVKGKTFRIPRSNVWSEWGAGLWCEIMEAA
jgi:hypothetical protein